MKKKNDKVTIKMVSEKAKVSQTTISRFLNGKYEYMSLETKQKIQEVIDDLEYRPDPMARSLKNKKTGLIGMIVADITNPFSSIAVKGVNDACIKESYQVIVANTDDDPEKEKEYIRSMIDRHVEGIVINTAGGNDDFFMRLKQKGILMSLVDRRLEKAALDTVTTDNERVTEEMIHNVYKEGFDKIAFFTQELLQSTSRLRRYNTFIEVSKKYVKNPDSLVYIIGNNQDNFKNYKDAFLQCKKDHANSRLAIFTVNGVVLLEVLNVVQDLKLKIPGDIGICGYDDWGWSNIVGNGISVISQPSYEVGKKSAELLIQRIKSSEKDYPPQYIELKSKCCMRGSTKLRKE